MQSGYVLHRRRYRETSLIVEFLTREEGRVAAVARGALRRKSALAAVLQPLVPLSLEMRGRGELLTLIRAEASGPAVAISGAGLYSIFYLNELIMRLTVVHDPQPLLCDIYAATLASLASDAPLEPCLRGFERDLLEVTGLGMILDCNVADGAALGAELEYDYIVDRGPVPAAPGSSGCRVHGATLLALAGDLGWTENRMREAKQLMRYVLNHHLDGRPLAARDLFAATPARKS